MAEWALVLFTVLSQMAAGAFVTLWFLDRFTGRIENGLGMFAAQGITAAMGLALLASLGHLGQPLESYRALSQLGTSWLSREVAAFGLFFALTVVYCWQWRTGAARGPVGLAGSVVAVLAVVSSGMVYTLPAQPAWNNAGPLLFFLLTAFSLGPLFIAVLAHFRQYAPAKAVFWFVAAMLGCSLTGLAMYTTIMLGAEGVARLTGWNLVSGPVFWLRLILGILAPLGLLAYAGRQPAWNERNYVPVLFVLVLIGELLGRGLFYGSAVALKMFGS